MTASMDMYFLDVGQGDCTYIEAGDAGTDKFGNFLIDFGFKQRQFNGDHPAFQSLEILVRLITKSSRAQKLDRPELTRLFITHPDGDHWNMIGRLINGAAQNGDKLWETIGGWKAGTTLKLNGLAYGAGLSQYFKGGDAWLPIRDAVDPGDITTLADMDHDDQDGMDGSVDPRWRYVGGDLKVFLINSNYPKREGKEAPNPKSLCLIFQYDGFKLLLMGDAEPTTVGETLKSRYGYDDYQFLRCDALKLAHHGSRKGTPEWWPEIVQPKYAFVSGDYFWSHPYHEAIENVYKANTLKTNFFKHWMASSRDDEKDYVSESIKKSMFANLWYVVTTAGTVTGNNQKGVSKTYGKGTYIGVAWLLQKTKGNSTLFVNYSPEDVWPGIDVTPT